MIEEGRMVVGLTMIDEAWHWWYLCKYDRRSEVMVVALNTIGMVVGNLVSTHAGKLFVE